MLRFKLSETLSSGFQLNSGEICFERDILILLGPNGSGKSTFLRALSTHEAFSGNSVLMSSDLDFSDSLYLSEILEVLKMELPVPLLEFKNSLQRPIYSFSSGQVQRFLVYCYLNHPTREFVFLDEPTNFLDPKFKYDLVSYLKACPKRIVIATHDISWAIQLTKAQSLLLNSGKTVHQGPIHQLVESLEMQKAFQMSFTVEDNKEEQFLNLKVST